MQDALKTAGRDGGQRSIFRSADNPRNVGPRTAEESDPATMVARAEGQRHVIKSWGVYRDNIFCVCTVC